MSGKTERELKLFVLASHLKKEVDLRKLDWMKLSQSYFADSTIEAAYRIIFKRRDKIPALMTGRVRRTTSKKGVTKYFATFKGPYLSEYSREEHEKEISKELHDTLLVLCQGHAVQKTRYHLPGHIIVRGRKIGIKAEIDHLTSWSDDFFTIDLEVSSDQLIKALRKGDHSFDFLNSGAIDITKEPFTVRRALSMKFLARNGFSPATKKVIRQLIIKARTLIIT